MVESYQVFVFQTENGTNEYYSTAKTQENIEALYVRRVKIIPVNEEKLND